MLLLLLALMSGLSLEALENLLPASPHIKPTFEIGQAKGT